MGQWLVSYIPSSPTDLLGSKEPMDRLPSTFAYCLIIVPWNAEVEPWIMLTRRFDCCQNRAADITPKMDLPGSNGMIGRMVLGMNIPSSH